MLAFKLVRKIGKMLRGGAGKREIFLGAFCGVLLGFNVVGGLSLGIMVLLTLLLNANIGFVLLGLLLGKTLALTLAPLTFHTGYFIIHQMGLENLFVRLVNKPVLALMGLDVYAQVGGFFFALLVGSGFGIFMTQLVTRVREQMVKAGEKETLSKIANNGFARFLMWIVFGKQKISTADVLAKNAPFIRKSGVVVVAVLALLGGVTEYLLLDKVLKSGVCRAIEARTGAEVNLAEAHFSAAKGLLELEGLQVTNPDQLEENRFQIKKLVMDLSMSELLRKNYAIEQIFIEGVQTHVPREKPGKRIVKTKKTSEKESSAQTTPKEEAGKPLEAYFAQANQWKDRLGKLSDFLKQRKENAEAIACEEEPAANKAAALQQARNIGYLRVHADLAKNHPDWTIRSLEIRDIQMGDTLPVCHLSGLYLSSHPEFNHHPTLVALTPDQQSSPALKVVFHFENPALEHELLINLPQFPLEQIKTSSSFPLDLQKGSVDLHLEGTFSTEQLQLPFQLTLHDLQARVEDGESVLGMDAQTANQVFKSINKLEIDGNLTGSLRAPHAKVDLEKLQSALKDALISAGKKELSNRAGKEINKQVDHLLEGEENQEIKKKTKGLLKKLF